VAKIRNIFIEQYKGRVYNLKVRNEHTFVANNFVVHNCPHCRRLHLESDGVTPKIYRLSDVLANGTNVGKKADDWQMVINVVHPNCRCQLVQLPKGYFFNKLGKLEFVGEKEATKKISESLT